MRQTWNAEFLYNELNELIGIDLGADYCAEHEGSISDLKRTMGISPITNVQFLDLANINESDMVFGLERIKPRHDINNIIHRTKYQNKKMTHYGLILSSNSWLFRDGSPKKNTYAMSFSSRPEKEDDIKLRTAWSDSGFEIIVLKEHKKELDILEEALRTNNFLIGKFKTENPFERKGLTILILDKIPQETLDYWEKYDKEEYSYSKEISSIGIVQKLKDANKRWFALSPGSKKVVKDDGTEEKVLAFFLNPYNQSKYNHGWFTVEELEQWINEEGPIIRV